jgi:DNA-binding CsgD family transcriptional regulator
MPTERRAPLGPSLEAGPIEGVRSASRTWPLAGRREELAFVTEVRGRMERGGLVIAGAPGVGKTRLAREALREAEVEGLATAWATATVSARSIPFGALAPLLPVPAGGGASPLDVLRRAGKAFADVAGGRPLLICIDDAHLLDGASATLAQQLAATGAAFVMATVRTGEAAPEPIVALWKDGLAEYLELQALSKGDVEQLLHEALGGDVDGATALGLWRVSGGNVLFLHELVLDGLDRAALTRTGDVWRWHGPLTVGARLSQLIEARLRDLASTERNLLELVAVGEPLGANILELLATQDALEALERRGLLTVSRDGRRLQTRLAHPLYGEALRGAAPSFHMRAICRRLADAVEASGTRRRDDLLRVATWRLGSGDRGRPDLLVAASRRAQSSFDSVLAERLAEAAVTSGGGFRARHALGEALRGQGRFGEAEALFAPLESDVTTDEERMMVVESRTLNLIWGLDRPREAEDVMARAETAVVDPASRDQLAALRGMCAYFAGRPRDAISAMTDILAREDVEPSMGVRASLAAAHSLAMAGRAGEAIAVVDRWSPEAMRLTDELPQAVPRLNAGRVCALELGGWLDQAEAAAEEGYRSALAERAHEGGAIFAMLLGAVSLVEGRLTTAARWLHESAALLRELDPLGLLPWPLAFLAQTMAQAGDAEAAASAVDEAEASRWPGMRIFEFDLGLAHAWVAAARGQLSIARGLMIETADAAENSGQFAFAVLALHDLARLGDPMKAAPRLEALASSVQGPLATACAQHTAALVANDGRALDDVAASFEAIGALLLAAETAADAATVHHSAGRESSARTSRALAKLLIGRCEGADTPKVRLLDTADDLTVREHEIAMLAASGLSSRAIAEHLVLSIRTVENHLQRAYTKLGVTGRSELRLLFEHADVD